MDEKLNLPCPKLKIHNRIYRNSSLCLTLRLKYNFQVFIITFGIYGNCMYFQYFVICITHNLRPVAVWNEILVYLRLRSRYLFIPVNMLSQIPLLFWRLATLFLFPDTHDCVSQMTAVWYLVLSNELTWNYSLVWLFVHLWGQPCIDIHLLLIQPCGTNFRER